jgi:hypothetical protein
VDVELPPWILRLDGNVTSAPEKQGEVDHQGGEKRQPQPQVPPSYLERLVSYSDPTPILRISTKKVFNHAKQDVVLASEKRKILTGVGA